jgi:hypothetical protein
MLRYPKMAAAPDRIETLAKRVRWLDRYRRALSVTLAVVAWLVISHELAALFGADWPSVVPGIVATLPASAAWWIIEIGFAWTIALWETEHDKLSRDRGLPRAELRRWRRRPPAHPPAP